MAEGFARHISGSSSSTDASKATGNPSIPFLDPGRTAVNLEVQSAGIESHGLNPMAVQVMAEAGVDISSHVSRVIQPDMLQQIDLVVTVCGHADEHCPVLPSGVRRMHWPLPDPGKSAESGIEQIRVFRASRDDIRDRVTLLVRQLQAGDIHKPETFGKDDVRVHQRESAYRGFFELQKLRLQHRLFAGGWSVDLVRELFVRGAAVAVLPYDPVRQEIALVEQFRIGALDDVEGPWLYELVAGIVAEGEEPAAVARQECSEEMGKVPYYLRHLFEYLVSPGGTNEKIHLYLGLTDLGDTGGLHGLKSEGEDIRVSRLSIADAAIALKAGRINNAATIMALQWLLLNKEQMAT
jgi:ADP-ribose pyrophosphatase